MLNAKTMKTVQPRTLVVAPMMIISAILVLSAVYLTHSGVFRVSENPKSIALAVALYCATLLGIARFTIGQIRRLEQLSLTDSLSGLPNRRALHLDIQKYAGPDDEVSLALIDLDGFKLVNDHHGHAVGDRLIRTSAHTLLQVCGAEARCYRLGGDEFAVAMVGPLAGTILEGMCRTVVDAFTKPVSIDDRRISIGASVGLSRSTPDQPISSSELLRRSDVAMYASKRAGKRRCTWFSESFDRNREALQDLDEELRLALARREFRVAYQPLVDATSGTIVAVESLVRWDHPKGKQIGPNVFIPAAEESGLINGIGLWVLRQSCQDALPWDGIKLSVNISAAQLRNPEFPINLGQILEETGFPAERLELEITETCLVLDPVIAERSLDVIRGFGVSVALDDFGTGYASIGFLRQFRFEKLKLDRSLVVDAETDSGSLAMMASSVSVARAMSMDVTAEGVETEAQADLVRAAGCDQIQGWLYFRAMPAADIGALLIKQADGLSLADAAIERIAR